MLFLLAAQPEMLPPSASRDPYVYACYDILQLAGLDCSSDEEVLCLLGRYAEDDQPEVLCDVNKTLRQAAKDAGWARSSSALSSKARLELLVTR